MSPFFLRGPMATETISTQYSINKAFILRHLVIFLLGIASGLPLALSAGTLQTWFAVNGASKFLIANIGLLGLPYILKFIWAPLMDRFKLGRFGRRRGWIGLTQIGLICTLFFMAWCDPKLTPQLLLGLGFFCAFISASQDIAIDAYRADLLSTAECGLGAALAAGGYRVGMLVSGAFALIWADYYGWKSTYLLMAAVMAAISITTFFSPPVQRQVSLPQTLAQAVIEPFREFFQRDYAMAMIGFIFLFKIGEAFTANAGGIINTFLLRECNLSLTQIALMNKFVGLGSLMFGIFVGGVTLLRVQVDRALLLFILLQAITNLGYFILASFNHSHLAIISVIGLDNFAAGLGNTAIIALLMQICNQRYTATQFAALSSIAVIGRVVLAPITGLMLENLSWSHFFIWTFLLALPAYPALEFLRRNAPQWFIAYYRH